jgi:uncharacterized protein (DUF302 family)
MSVTADASSPISSEEQDRSGMSYRPPPGTPECFLGRPHLGAILRRETGSDMPRITRFVVGNPLIMKEMVKHVPDAGSNAPVTILMDERPDGVYVSYDKMESCLWPYGSSEALAVARNLDAKITTLLRECAG